MKTGQKQLAPNSDGTYPTCAWPGGYPIFYLAADDSVVCAGCANGSAYRTWNEEDLEHLIIASDINWEDAHLFCDDCQERIESANAEDETETDILGLTYDRAESMHQTGHLSDAEWEHYRYLWRNSAFHLSSLAQGYERKDS